MPSYSLSHLPDPVVSHQLHAAASTDRLSTASLLARIAEFDHRQLYLPTSCPSMYRYCVGKLKMSEDAAAKRIQAARVARKFPSIFPALAEGRLHLSGVVLLAPHLTPENADELLAAATDQSKEAIAQLIARRFPRHVTAGSESAMAGETGGSLSGPRAMSPAANASNRTELTATGGEHAPGHVLVLAEPPTLAPVAVPVRQAKVKPIAPGRYELIAILGQEAYDQLEGSRELLGHAVPSGDLLEVLERAIALQFAQLRKRRCGATDRPRRQRDDAAVTPIRNPRHVPAAVRRAVWERDGGRCAFVGADGHRCESGERIELDHVVPIARGGLSTVENMRLLCRPHNQHEAERELGREHVQRRRELARRERARARVAAQASAARAQARAAATTARDDDLRAALRGLGFMEREARRGVELAGAMPEASLETCLRRALTELTRPVAQRGERRARSTA
jgi:5-methylcytosine-specific restriction endonuclease McrA